jgi:hypothetical protein
MPIGPQSLQAFIASSYNTDPSATVWKTKQDANSAIVSQTAGPLYVYPNSPVAMSVFVGQRRCCGQGDAIYAVASDQTVWQLTMKCHQYPSRLTRIRYFLALGAAADDRPFVEAQPSSISDRKMRCRAFSRNGIELTPFVSLGQSTTQR